MAGNWLGTLAAGPVELRLVLKATSKDGQLRATLDSIDQAANDLPVDQVTVDGDRFVFTMPMLRARFEGKIDSAAATVDGTWTQAGNAMPLVFKRVAEVPTVRRPQEPKRPFPYKEEQVTIESAPGIRLGGTLTLPKDAKGAVPAVVLITGSGPQDRDESLMGHRPFLVLSDHLTRAGIAVLRCDDRGVGKSTGDHFATTTDDAATDALAGVAFLKTRPEVDRAKVGLIGHSEGGVIAPVAAARNPGDVAFIVLLAGVGVPVPELLRDQAEDIARAEGAPPEVVAKAVASQRRTLDLLAGPADDAEVKRQLRAMIAADLAAVPEAQRKAAGGEAAAEGQVRLVTSPWFRQLLRYDPKGTLAKVRCPVLAVNGERDIQVRAKANLSAIKAGVLAGGNKEVETVELPGLNHLFQPSETGKLSEYGKIEQTFAPAALDVVTAWVARRTK